MYLHESQRILAFQARRKSSGYEKKRRDVAMRIATTIVTIIMTAAPLAFAGSIPDAVEAARGNSSQYDSHVLQIPQSVLTGAAQADSVNKTMGVVNSSEFQERVRVEQDRLRSEVFGGFKSAPYYVDAPAQKTDNAPPRLADDERVYLFISSSIPESTLRAYVADIDRLQDPNITMVMRGFIGSMRDALPSMEFIMRIRKKDPACAGMDCPTYGTPVDFDPNLYRRFKPAVVPALVYVRGVKPVDPDVSEGSTENVPVPDSSAWSMIYGDVSLGYLIEQIAQATPSPTLSALARYLGH